MNNMSLCWGLAHGTMINNVFLFKHHCAEGFLTAQWVIWFVILLRVFSHYDNYSLFTFSLQWDNSQVMMIHIWWGFSHLTLIILYLLFHCNETMLMSQWFISLCWGLAHSTISNLILSLHWGFSHIMMNIFYFISFHRDKTNLKYND